MSVSEIIKSSLDNSDLNFETWTGNEDEFIVSKDGEKYRVTVSPEEERFIHIHYDYQDIEEDYTFGRSNLEEAFDRMAENAGMIIEIGDTEYYWESMEDHEAGILSCLDSSGKAVRLPIEEHLKELMRKLA